MTNLVRTVGNSSKELSMAGMVILGMMLTHSAYAADGGVSSLGNAFSGALEGVTSPLSTLFVAAVGILTLFVAWRYFKRGANSA